MRPIAKSGIVTALARSIVCALSLAAAPAALAATAPTAATATAEAVQEIVLPNFQAAALAADEPIRDLLLEPNGTAWLLGRTSLWRWASETRNLKRLRLGDDATLEKAALKRLGTDGISVFALGETALMQAQWSDGRVFRYSLPRGEPLGFAGVGDEFRILHTAGVLRFDRYGKILRPEMLRAGLEASDRAVFDPKTGLLWVARKNKLMKIQKTEAGVPTATITLSASHALRDLEQVGDELILHTASAVLRVGPNGKLKQSIPVESRRKLLIADVDASTHAYFFDDDLLEVYAPKTQAMHRYLLPLDGVDAVDSLRVRGDFLALIADGRPRLFRALATPSQAGAAPGK